MGIELKNGQVTCDRRLDRIPQFDEKSRQYPIRSLISTENPLRSYTWRVEESKNVPLNLDQGSEGACVGFGFTHELAARPVVVSGLTNQFARELYWDVQKNDPWPGGSYEGAEEFYEGTSVLSGAKTLLDRGHYSAYHWAFSEREVALAVGYRGPVVLGLNWYSDMFDTDENGFIHPTGEWAGGHCLLAQAINVKGDYYWLWNSWGSSWGVNGRAKIKRSDLALLLAQDGEACLPVRAPIGR